MCIAVGEDRGEYRVFIDEEYFVKELFIFLEILLCFKFLICLNKGYFWVEFMKWFFLYVVNG